MNDFIEAHTHLLFEGKLDEIAEKTLQFFVYLMKKENYVDLTPELSEINIKIS